MFKTSETRKNLFAAILRAKKNFDPVIKDATNPYFKSKYESLNGVLDAVETALNNEGVILLQPSSTDCTSNFITTRLEHVETGEFADSTLKLEKTGNMQEVGAASTYGRRQTLKGLLGLKAEDDDGNVASGKKVEANEKAMNRSNTSTTASKTTTPTQVTTEAKKGPGRPAKTPTDYTEQKANVAKEIAAKITNGYSGNGTNGKTVNKPEVLTQEDEW